MPATGPIPVEVAKCFEGQAGKYGKDVVSTGPYMIEGADKVDDSSCAKLKPMSGFDGVSNLTLVRNPDYDPKTDSPAARQSFPDEFQFTIDPNVTDIVDRVGAGELEDENAPSLPPQALEQYATDSSKKPYLHLNPGDLVDYITMNLTQPPFDDIHVRKAMNWIIDKDALRQIWGGPLLGKIAGHIVPDSIFDNQLAEYDPYATPGDHGSLAKAKAAMKGSKYDTKHDGTCSAAACKNVLLLVDTASTYQRMLPDRRGRRGEDRHRLPRLDHRRRLPDAPDHVEEHRDLDVPGLGQGLRRRAHVLQADLRRPHRSSRRGTRTTRSSASRPRRRSRSGSRGASTDVPSVDSQVDRCGALAGQARLSCYEALDRTLMTKVVPWVPYLFQNVAHIVGPKVTQWGYDQFSASTAYAHVAVLVLARSGGAARGRRGPSRGCRTTSSSTRRASGCGRCR